METLFYAIAALWTVWVVGIPVCRFILQQPEITVSTYVLVMLGLMAALDVTNFVRYVRNKKEKTKENRRLKEGS